MSNGVPWLNSTALHPKLHKRGSRRGTHTGVSDPFPSLSGSSQSLDRRHGAFPARRAQPAAQRQPTTLNTTITTSRNTDLDGWRSVLAAQPSVPAIHATRAPERRSPRIGHLNHDRHMRRPPCRARPGHLGVVLLAALPSALQFWGALPVTLSNRSAYDVGDRNIIKLGNRLRLTSQIMGRSLCQSK